jgi:hypothetical protein
VEFDDPPSDRQTEASAQLCGVWRLPVRIEDVIQLRLRNPVTAVAHGELDLVERSPPLDAHAAVAARELDRVSDEVHQHLENSVAIAVGNQSLVVEYRLEADLLLRSARTRSLDGSR